MANNSTINPIKNQSKRCYPPTPHPKSGLSKKSKTTDAAFDNPTIAAHEPNKVPFQRIWSDSQEIVLLTALLHFKQIENPAAPVHDLYFTEDSLKSLSSEFTKKQLKNKLRTMRGKYGKNVAMENEGKGLSFASAHNARAYQLSKHIWGNGGGEEWESESRFSIAKVLRWIRRVTQKDACEAEKEKEKVISETAKETVSVNLGSGIGVGNVSDATKKDAIHRGLIVKKESQNDENPAPNRFGLGQLGGCAGPLPIKGDIMNYGLEYLKDSERNKLAKMWENFGVCEYLLEKKRAKLIKKQMGMVWKAMESSGKLTFTKQT